MKFSRAQLRALADIEPALVASSEGEPDVVEIELADDGTLRVRDVERDYYIERDGSRPWG